MRKELLLFIKTELKSATFLFIKFKRKKTPHNQSNYHTLTLHKKLVGICSEFSISCNQLRNLCAPPTRETPDKHIHNKNFHGHFQALFFLIFLVVFKSVYSIL